jgi:hypothetical protein
MTPEEFFHGFATKLREKAAELRTYGAGEIAQTFDQISIDLGVEFRTWWLAELSVAEAAAESGYCEERLREMARQGSLPHQKGDGTKGRLTIARCDLPRRPRGSPTSITSIEERLLKSPGEILRRPA